MIHIYKEMTYSQGYYIEVNELFMQGNELFIQENEIFIYLGFKMKGTEIFNRIVICKEIVLFICKEMSYSYKQFFSYKEVSCSYESFIAGFEFLRRIVQRNRVIHTRK